MEISILTVCYLIGSITFILGLKMLSSPATARKGNLIAAAGMTLAILGTIFLYEEDGVKLGNYAWIFGGLIIGSIIGTLAAKKDKMTAMPELVSLFNGMGGACAALISIIEFNHLQNTDFFINSLPISNQGEFISTTLIISAPIGTLLTIFLGLIIGSISFAGSVIAWG